MGYFEDTIANDSSFTLDDAIDIIEREFREDFLEYWGLDATECPEHLERDDWIECRKIYDLARQTASVATSLLQKKGLGKSRLALPDVWRTEGEAQQLRIDKLLEMVEELPESVRWQVSQAFLPFQPSDPRTKHNIFRNALQLEAAELFRISVGNIASRLRVLVDYLVRSANPRTASYLKRVATCYALNMPTEFAVMARAVLESAIESFVDDETIEARLGRLGPTNVRLERRIEYCSAVDIFDSATQEAANRVRVAGNQAAHAAPGLEPDLDTLLEDLVKSLEAIDTARDAG